MDDYLLRRRPLTALLIFALPMMLGSFFQQLYNMADAAIVGRYVSQQALAAVGASSALCNVFIHVAVGGGIGASVIVSRYFGARDFRKMKTAVYTAMLAFFAISVALAVMGFLVGRTVMVWLKTPADVMDLAMEYLNIYFLGLPMLFMYNISSSMFNALGRSRIPLAFLIFSSALNVVLDYYMVTALRMGVAGVAWATLIAQGISALLSIAVLLVLLDRMGERTNRLFDGRELATMGRIALPSVFQQSTVSIGLMLVQSAVNSFGTEALAGFSAGSRIETIAIVPMISIGNAMSSYVAQNIGAGQQERVRQGYRAANFLVVCFAVLDCVILQLFYHPFVAFFLGDNLTAEALATGEGYLRFIGWFLCLIGFKMAVDGVLRGSGDMKMFTVANMVNLSLRVFIAVALSPVFGVQMVWVASPIGWLCNWAISYSQYRTGKWRQIYRGKED